MNDDHPLPTVPFELLGARIPEFLFCGGAFGRDFTGKGYIEAAGRDWVVFRSDDGGLALAQGLDSIELIRADLREAGVIA